MTWVLIIALAWLVLSVIAALLIAGTIHLADARRTDTQESPSGNFAVDLPPSLAPAQVPGPRSRRRSAAHHEVSPAEQPSAPRRTGTR